MARTDGNAAMDQPDPDVPAIMAHIRERIKADAAAQRDVQPEYRPQQPGSERVRRAGELVASEELRYLNSNYAFGPRLNLESITSHRPGLLGRLIVKVKRKLLNLVWDLLKDYFASEREYHANLVRYLNDVSKYVDARDAGNFWELIRKIDVDVTRALERIERINDEQMAALRMAERGLQDQTNRGFTELNLRLSELDAARAGQGSRVETLEGVVRGLEQITAGLERPLQIQSAESSVITEQRPDYSYLLLENRFRGSEESILERLSFYPELFAAAELPVLELGPGRGELQRLLQAAGRTSYGVDPDLAMVEHCTGLGLDVRLGDGIEHLAALPDRSLGGVIAVQVVEHLTRSQLETLIRLCAVKVAAGGRIVFETINPRSLLALSSNYFRDPTHQWPLHPDTLEYALQLGGLRVTEVRELSPVSAEAQLRPLPIEDYMTPRWAFAIERLNANFEQLNSLLYGNQDYCIVAEAQEAGVAAESAQIPGA